MPQMITLEERQARGTAARTTTPRRVHADWVPAQGRRSPVELLEQQDADREPDLVPVRHGRMMVSPFTFYRGAAKVMAEDLRDTPTAGLLVQLCGDAHLSNFGIFGSPERRLVFDLNDFDETLPGPFEYDVKRMAVSFVAAGRDNGFTAADTRDAAMASVTAYRTAMAAFARLKTMDVWYASADEDTILDAIRSAGEPVPPTGKAKPGKKKEAKKAGVPDAKLVKFGEKRARELTDKARTRDSLQALSKLGEVADGRYRIVSQPPIVVPVRHLSPEASPEQVDQLTRGQRRQRRHPGVHHPAPGP